MSKSRFVSLHTHTHSSQLDGYGTVSQFIKRSVELNYPYLGRTEHGNIDGILEFQNVCKKNNIIPVHGCLLKGQLITTIDGVKEIENIKIGDYVLTHKGRFKKVINTLKRIYNGKLYTINLAKNRTKLTLTEEHPVLVRERNGYIKWITPDKIKYGRYNKIGGVNCWNGWVCVPKLKYNNRQISFDLLKYLPRNFYDRDGRISRNKIHKYDRSINWDINRSILIDEDLAYFLGLYIGDGSTAFRKTFNTPIKHSVFSFGIHKRNLSLWVINFLKERFNIIAKEYLREDKNISEVVFSCRPINEWLLKCCGRGARNKKIPPELFKCNPSIRNSLIRGLIDTDGSTIYNNQIGFKVASRNLAWQFKILIASNGFWSKMSIIGDESFSVTFSPNRRYSRTLDDDHYIYIPISHISSREGICEVFNITVDEDNSYVSDFILHNCELYIVPDINNKEGKRFHINAFVQNEIGLKNLYKMLTIANLEGFYKRPRIDPSILLENREGLLFSSACALSFINMEGGLDLLHELHSNKKIYLEVMPHNEDIQKKINNQKLKLSYKYKIPLIATLDTHYPLKEHAKVQEVLLAIQRKAKWNDPDRWKFTFNSLYLQSYSEVIKNFAIQNVIPKRDYLKAIHNTIEFASQCEFEIPILSVDLPKVPTYADRDEDELLVELIEEGLEERELSNKREYRNRINKELEIIRRFNFQRYFLIVYELMHWCKQNNILTGFGRGSVGGSLIAYALFITEVDPIKYNLVFERFLNPGRTSSLPDIDCDFEDIKRPLVREHLNELYGKYNVVGLSTFLTLKSRGALRDVARVFDIDMKEVDIACKSIPQDMSIQSAIDAKIPEINEFYKRHKEVVNIAIALDGQIRGSGSHAAGVCISKDDLRNGDRCNLAIRKNVLVSNLDMNEAEPRGLMKLDILGLSALTILNFTRTLIKQNYNINIEFNKIPLNDQRVFDEMSRGNNAGIFQFNAAPTTRLCKEMGIKDFNDLVMVNALVRPGTLASGLTSSYIARRHNEEEITYIHPKLKKYTDWTYGIIVFQEQIMWLMNEIGGLDWGVCDQVRKVIGKSKGEEAFNEFKQLFIDGCRDNKSLSPKEANDVWEKLATFGSYSFNLAHSVEYSLISYLGAWLKINYPKEYMCALLTYESDKKADYIIEAKRLGLEVILPTRALSDATIWKPSKTDNKIFAPFTEIKGIGESKAKKFAEEKLYSDTFSFFNIKTEKKDKFDKILDNISKFKTLTDIEIEELQQYLDFPLEKKGDYFKKLGLGRFSYNDLINCNLNGFKGNLLEIKKFPYIVECNDCELRQECKHPVSPSFGRYNVMVLGEAPGKEENKEGIGFTGRSGQALWAELEKYGLDRNMFHVCNVTCCFPSKTKTPERIHIKACSRHLNLQFEELKPILVLAFGNTALKFFKDKDKGISEYSGRTEWHDKYKCWVHYCIHPAATLYNINKKEDFSNAISNFVSILRKIGGNYLSKSRDQIIKQTCPYDGRFCDDNNEYDQCANCKIWNDCATAKSLKEWRE